MNNDIEFDKAVRSKARLRDVKPEHRDVMIDQIMDTIDPRGPGGVLMWTFVFRDDQEVLDRINQQFT